MGRCWGLIVVAVAGLVLVPTALARAKPTPIEMHVAVRVHIPLKQVNAQDSTSYDESASAAGVATARLTGAPGTSFSIPLAGIATLDDESHFTIPCAGGRTFAYTDSSTGTGNLIRGGAIKPAGRGSVAVLQANGKGDYTVSFTYGTRSVFDRRTWNLLPGVNPDACNGSYDRNTVATEQPRLYQFHANLGSGHAAGHFRVSKYFDVTWSLDQDGVIAARPGPSRAVQRGAIVTLDGSQSFSTLAKITRYVWQLTPAPGACDVGQGAGAVRPKAVTRTLTTPTLRVAVLCPVNVQLTVYDKAGRHAAAGSALAPSPRVWQTPYQQAVPAPAPLGPVAVDATGGTCSPCTLGANVGDGFGTAGYVDGLIEPTVLRDRQGVAAGYTPRQVHDGGGPFDDWWYVTSPTLRVSRHPLVNAPFWPGGTIAQANATAVTPPYTEPLNLTESSLLAAIEAHEELHGQLAYEALGLNDPRIAIEPLASPTKRDLVCVASRALAHSEDALSEAASNANVKARLAALGVFSVPSTVLLPLASNPSAFVAHIFPDLSQIIDEAAPRTGGDGCKG